MRLACVIFILLAYWQGVQAQITIRGTIIRAEDSSALPGVTVVVEGMSGSGTISNEQGQYEITVPNSDCIVVFSFVGFKYKEVALVDINNNQLDICLEYNPMEIDHVAILRYAELGFGFGNTRIYTSFATTYRNILFLSTSLSIKNRKNFITNLDVAKGFEKGDCLFSFVLKMQYHSVVSKSDSVSGLQAIVLRSYQYQNFNYKIGIGANRGLLYDTKYITPLMGVELKYDIVVYDKRDFLKLSPSIKVNYGLHYTNYGFQLTSRFNNTFISYQMQWINNIMLWQCGLGWRFYYR